MELVASYPILITDRLRECRDFDSRWFDFEVADGRTVGRRRFATTDPVGVWVDVVDQIEPAAGWWDRYL
jgi:hypothetical protein